MGADAITYLLYFSQCLLAATADIFVKQYNKKTRNIKGSSNCFNLLIAATSALYYGILWWLSGERFSADVGALLLALLRGAGYVTGMIGYLQAMRCGPLLLSIVISKMGVLIPILCAVLFYGDPLSIPMLLGALLLFPAILLFNGGGGAGGGGGKTSPRFRFFIFLSFLGNGVAMLATRIQQTEYVGAYKAEHLFFSMLFSVPAFLLFFLLSPPSRCDFFRQYEKTERARLSAGSFRLLLVGGPWVLCYALGSVGNGYLGMLTITKLPAVFYYFASTGFGILLAFLIARFLYREKLTRAQYLGCLFAAAGLILLNF